MSAIIDWVQQNPELAVAIAIYVFVNLAPRPDPEKLSGWQKVFWTILDRISVLTADKVPGRVKWLLMDTERPTGESQRADALDEDRGDGDDAADGNGAAEGSDETEQGAEEKP